MINIFKYFFKKTDNKIPFKEKMEKPCGSTEEEIKQFFVDWGQVDIGESTIKIYNYPFSPSIAFGTETFTASEIQSLDIDSAPPTLKIGSELIFVSAEHKHNLQYFAKKNGIPIVRESLIWGWILEPFLDTEFTSDNEININKRLEQHGLSELEVYSLRSKVEEQMLKYNFDTMLWNWTGFSTIDVLLAMRPKLSELEFKKFYIEVMRIAFLPQLSDG